MTITATRRGRATAAGVAALLLAAPLAATTASSAGAVGSVDAGSSAKKRTVVTLKVSGAVTFPAKVKLTGKLATTSGKALAERQVRVFTRAAGTTSWKLVAKARTGRTGGYSLSTAATRTSQFKTTFTGSSKYRADASPVRTTTVKPLLAMSLPARSEVYSDVSVTGRFAPARPGRTVVLQAYAGGRWAGVATTKLDARSNYSFTVFFQGEGTAKLRVVSAAASDLGAGSSAARTLTVTNTATPPPPSGCATNPTQCENPPAPPVPGGAGGGGVPW